MWKKILQPLFEAEKLVKGYEKEQHQKRLCCTTSIAVIGLVLMSVLNAMEHVWPMVGSTLGAAIVLSVCILMAWKKKRVEILETVFLILFMILFPVYIIRGGNGGFAILWLTIIPIVFMLMICFLISFYVAQITIRAKSDMY